MATRAAPRSKSRSRAATSTAPAASTVDRPYHVVAMSMPIVYTLEGDHDPDGMAYVLKPVHSLLKWAKDRWYENDRLLPNLNFRRQRMQVVIDGLERLEVMIERLVKGPDEDQALLAELIRREELPEYSAPDDRLSHAHRAQGGRPAAVRTNVMHQIESLRIALESLRATDARALAAKLAANAKAEFRPDPDEAPARAPAAAPSSERAPQTLAKTDRAQRLALWREQQKLDKQLAIEEAFGVEEEEADAGNAERAEPAEPEEGEIRLVTLSPEERKQWRQHWIAQASLVDDTIAQVLRRIDAQWDHGDMRHGGFAQLKRDSEIEGPWIERLLLNDHRSPATRHLPCDRFNPLKPIPALRPLVLRCREGESVGITFENSMRTRRVGFHLQGGCMEVVAAADNFEGCQPGHGVRYADGASLGENHDSTVPPGSKVNLRYQAKHQGVWPLNDLGDVRGDEDGTNAHGLFGALIVEAPSAKWRDPERGGDLTAARWCSLMDVDIVFDGEDLNKTEKIDEYVDLQSDKGMPRSHREFTVFIHDEPSVHSGYHTVGEHALMPLSYRAEPMHNRLPHRMRHYAEETRRRPLPMYPDAIDRTAVKWELGDELDEQFFTARNGRGEFIERVAGEEQHHSSWLFGDPITHIQRAYSGDPCRVRLVHAGVKETHVYHLHVHQWRAVASDTAVPSVKNCYLKGKAHGKGSQLLDSITIGPQSAMTIDPLYGSGSRQHSIGDIIWHCHLYPHFHHGMWGLWRSYDRRVDGTRAYPDGSYCPPLEPLPGREREGDPTFESTWKTPGFPWFIDGEFPMKSPPPPVPRNLARNGRRVLLRMPHASAMELDAMPEGCRDGQQPGAVFVDLAARAQKWLGDAGLLAGNQRPRIISYDVEVAYGRVKYNARGWHDPRGHYYRLLKAQVKEWDAAEAKYKINDAYTQSFTHAAETNPSPLFPRANHGDIVEWRQHNSLRAFEADKFDLAQLPVEVGLHVHLVKFDPLASDGSSTGWNYLSGASCREAVGADGEGELRTVSLHRWVVDEEFGPCFFHDHLLANFRQKHGLFAALIAEPFGSQWTKVDDQGARAWGDEQAVILSPASSGLPPYREACLGICDFVALLDGAGRALNPPANLSGDDDPGSMAVNYRSAPLTHRGKDPSQWFSSSAHSALNLGGVRGDPDTPLIQTYPGERLRIRLVQGSHEEQHGFALHGMRWRRDWGNPRSPFVNQQTLGISEAFTLDINPSEGVSLSDAESPYGVGDHLYHFCAIDDVWLGCWGLVRSLPPVPSNFVRFAPLPDSAPDIVVSKLPPRDPAKTRTFVVAARRIEHRMTGLTLTDPWGLIYSVIDHADPADAPAQARIEGQLTHARAHEAWDFDEDKYDDGESENDGTSRSASRATQAASSQGSARSQTLEREHRKRLEQRASASTRGDIARASQGRRRSDDGSGDNSEGCTTPLVLRARRGEWVRVILVNDLFEEDRSNDREDEEDSDIAFGVEPSPARLPLEHLDELFRPDERTVSSRVSLHASLVRYDVRHDDGSNVGHNPDTTCGTRRRATEQGESHAGPHEEEEGGVIHRPDHNGWRNWRDYWWYADEALAPASHRPDESPNHDPDCHHPGQVCFLHDMADLRNHRHHGLIGALVVLPGDVTPFKCATDREGSTSRSNSPSSSSRALGDGWHGLNAEIRDTQGQCIAHETAIFVQDGLRFFVNGHPDFPMPDAEPEDDPEDSGQKAVNYRSHPVHRGKVSNSSTDTFPSLTIPDAGTVWLRLIGAGDKPRQHTIAINGSVWASAPWVPRSDRIGALSGLSPCRVENIVIDLLHQGDYAVRAGGFRWASEHGVWASLRAGQKRNL